MNSNRDELKQLEYFEQESLPHLDYLFRAACSMVQNQAEAEELIQEVYQRAWKSFHHFTPGTDCRAWLFKIFFQTLQRNRRKWFRFIFADNGKETVGQTQAYELPVAQDLNDEEVLAAFRQLPPPDREVVLLSDVYDFSYEEIQRTLDISLDAVISRLSRGRRLLRIHLSEATRADSYQNKTAAVG